MMGPEYAILCLKISLLGRGGTNVNPEVDLNCGSFSFIGHEPDTVYLPPIPHPRGGVS